MSLYIRTYVSIACVHYPLCSCTLQNGIHNNGGVNPPLHPTTVAESEHLSVVSDSTYVHVIHHLETKAYFYCLHILTHLVQLAQLTYPSMLVH